MIIFLTLRDFVVIIIIVILTIIITEQALTSTLRSEGGPRFGTCPTELPVWWLELARRTGDSREAGAALELRGR